MSNESKEKHVIKQEEMVSAQFFREISVYEKDREKTLTEKAVSKYIFSKSSNSFNLEDSIAHESKIKQKIKFIEDVLINRKAPIIYVYLSLIHATTKICNVFLC